ncbi:MAG: cyclic nucleotide-binding domain-containing protein [Chromatiaceae bacterium]|jgi:CRP/FNR family transcriptional regulator, cyclic AMP receptor protein
MSEATSGELTVSPDVIKGSPLGVELSDAQCKRLASVVTASGLEKGELLVEEGHKDDSLHVVTRGTFDVVKVAGGGALVSLHVLHEGDMIGQLGFIDGVEHSAGVRALTNCELFTLHRKDLEELLREDPDLVYKVMRAIVRTVHAILRRMNIQYVEMTNYIAREHGRY